MPRYAARAYIADDCAFEARTAMPTVVITESDGHADTGLLDAGGRRIFRLSDRVPLGFLAGPIAPKP